MHYHAEILFPPELNPEEAVAEILLPFCEHEEENVHAFLDWYVIGGRYTYSHLESNFTEKAKEAFQKEIPDYKVSGLQTVGGLYETPVEPEGIKEELLALYAKHFPGLPCPYWGEGYEMGNDNSNPDDIITINNISPRLTCHTLIIAPSFSESKLRAGEMWQKQIWNGVTWQDTAFDGNVYDQIQKYNEEVLARCANSRNLEWAKEYGIRQVVNPDWQCVTVDYHS